MRTRRRSALVVLSALTGLTLVPVAPSFATEVAPPATVTSTLDDLPASADPAAPARAAGLDPAGGAVVSAPVTADSAFSAVGFRLPDGVDAVRVRTRDLDGSWGEWLELDRVSASQDGPDRGTAEAVTAVTDVTEPGWVGPSDALQVALDAGTCSRCGPEALDAVQAELIDTLGLNEHPLRAVVRHLTPRVLDAPAHAASRPAIVSRTGWGANERATTHRPSYRTPTFAVLHHTAGSNGYTRAQAAGVVRAIHSYHATTLGWGDIGYNLLVDRFGTIYEGRAGGLDRGVIGAHARGFNTGSFGVSVLGNFDQVDIPSVALESVARVVAWKYDLHGIDRSASRRMTVNGTTINTLAAHRNVGSTACPGRHLYARMGQLRTRVAALATGRSPAGSADALSRFPDVPRTHPFHDPIELIAVRRITQGCGDGLYCPSRSVTRAQMASFLVRARQLPALEGEPFGDVTHGPHLQAVSTLAAADITEGCRPDRYCPDVPVTRAQMATFISRAFSVPPAPERFPDVRSSSEHAGAIGGLVRAGIANGYGDGTFRPGHAVSRAEMAAFLARALASDAARSSS